MLGNGGFGGVSKGGGTFFATCQQREAGVDLIISAIKKFQHTVTEPARELVHQPVPGTGDLDKLCTVNPPADDTGIYRGDYHIIGPGDNKCWKTNFPKAGE